MVIFLLYFSVALQNLVVETKPAKKFRGIFCKLPNFSKFTIYSVGILDLRNETASEPSVVIG